MAFLFVLNRNNIRKTTQSLYTKKQILEKLNSTALYNISDFQKANEIRNSTLILDDDNFFVDISMDYFTNVSLWGFKSFAKKELIELYTKYSEKLSEKTKVKLCMTIIKANFQEYKQRFSSHSELDKYFLKQAEEICFASQDSLIKSYYYANLLYCGLYFNDDEKSNILNIALKHNVPKHQVYYAIGQRYRAEGERQKELYFIKAAAGFSASSVLLDELGVSYRNAGILDSAEYYLKKRNYQDGTNIISNKLIPAINFARLYIKGENFNKAKYYLNVADSIINIDNKIYHKQELFEIKTDYYTALGLKDSVISNLKNLNDFNRKTISNVNENLSNSLFYVKKIEKTKELIRLNKRIGIALSCLVFLLIMGLTKYFITKISKEKLAKSSLAKELQESQENLNFKLGEIAKILQTEMQKKQSIQNIIDNLKGEKIGSQLNNLVSELVNVNEKNITEWESYKANFSYIYPDFFSKLLHFNPNLTELDYMHACLIKQNMTNKEIAKLLNINTQSVATFRYRLKLKLNLDNNQDLRLFIIDL